MTPGRSGRSLSEMGFHPNLVALLRLTEHHTDRIPLQLFLWKDGLLQLPE